MDLRHSRKGSQIHKGHLEKGITKEIVPVVPIVVGGVS